MATKDTINNTNNVLNNLFDVKDKLTDKEYKDLMDSVMILPRFVKIKYLIVKCIQGEPDRRDDLSGKIIIGNYQVVKDNDRECCVEDLLTNGKVSQEFVDMYFEDEGNIHPVNECCNIICILKMWKI